MGRREQWAALGFAALAAAAGGLLGMRAAPPPTEVAAPVAATPVEGTITVHVAGWVNRPGLVEVPQDSVVADVVRAAGGARIGARVDGLNLAQPVADGDRVEVPGPDGSGSGAGGSPDDGLIDLNRAGVEELIRLPGVGPVLAERIVSHREANGPFRQVEDLLDVPGIGEAKLASIRDLVVVR